MLHHIMKTLRACLGVQAFNLFGLLLLSNRVHMLLKLRIRAMHDPIFAICILMSFIFTYSQRAWLEQAIGGHILP